MKKRLVSALALTAITLTLSAIPVAAQEGVPHDPAADAQITDANLQPGETTVTGVMEYRDVDGGKYIVGDWVLMGDTKLFEAHVGKPVVLYGLMWDGLAGTDATFMVRDLAPGKDGPGDAGESEQLMLTGTLEYKDVEGGYYAVDGYALVGADETVLAALAGHKVLVQATRDQSPSIFNVERARVTRFLQEVEARPAHFMQLTLNGKFVKLDQGAEIIDGVLMLPLRAVVEGLGGKVQWDDAARAVTVEMPDRMAYFWIGQEKAEMNQNNVRYIARNLIAMAKAPVLINSRTMISADAVTQILGLYASPSVDGTLNIVAAQ